jgi:hypothetical protein
MKKHHDHGHMMKWNIPLTLPAVAETDPTTMREYGIHPLYNESPVLALSQRQLSPERKYTIEYSPIYNDSVLIDPIGSTRYIDEYPRQRYDGYPIQRTEKISRYIDDNLCINEPVTLTYKETIKDGLAIKKIIKKMPSKSSWTKMTKDILNEMVDFERDHPQVKQCDLEKYFNVNRSTYWRWKRNYGIGKINANYIV